MSTSNDSDSSDGATSPITNQPSSIAENNVTDARNAAIEEARAENAELRRELCRTKHELNNVRFWLAGVERTRDLLERLLHEEKDDRIRLQERVRQLEARLRDRYGDNNI